MKEDKKIISNNTDIPADIKKIDDHETRSAIYKEVEAGNIKHKQLEASKKNLIPLNKRSPEEAAAIRRKGWEAMTALKGERKTAKQSLEQFLPLFANDPGNDENIPEDIRKLLTDNKAVKVTQYDLIMLSMINQARNGNIQAAIYIRDTFGDKPINEVHNVNEIISDNDKALIEKLQQRLNIVDIED